MSTWRPPWSAQGQFAVTLLPPTRAGNSVTARRPPGPGSTAALRAGSRDPCTPRPARRSGLAGWLPARPRHGQAMQYRHPGPRDSRAGGRRRPEHAPPHGPGPAGYGLVPALPHRSQPAAAAGSARASDIGSPQARGAVDTRDCGSVARTPRQRTRSTASSGTVRAPAAIPRGRLGLGARGARPASARTHEPGRIVAHESIGARLPAKRTAIVARMRSRLIGSEGPGASSVGFPATKSTMGSTAWNATSASNSGRYRR